MMQWAIRFSLFADERKNVRSALPEMVRRVEQQQSHKMVRQSRYDWYRFDGRYWNREVIFELSQTSELQNNIANDLFNGLFADFRRQPASITTDRYIHTICSPVNDRELRQHASIKMMLAWCDVAER